MKLHPGEILAYGGMAMVGAGLWLRVGLWAALIAVGVTLAAAGFLAVWLATRGPRMGRATK